MFDFNPLSQPPVGTVDPTKLYVERGSRQLWLGVDPSSDPTGSILISDIVAMLAYSDQSEADAKTYTDAQIATRAALSHTHPSSQITDFNSAVDARIASSPQAVVPVGTIMLYGGVPANIGSGIWANWHTCDGSQLSRTTYATLFGQLGTIHGAGNGSTTFNLPNLIDKFVLGAGNIAAGTKHAAADFATGPAGAHSHTGVTGVTTLTAAMLPAHQHSSGTLGGVTNSAGSHTHDLTNEVNKLTNVGSGGVWTVGGGAAIGPQNIGIANAGAHTHTVDVNSGLTGVIGSGAGHTHPVNSEADHAHAVTAVSNSIRDSLNWAAIVYVIKIA